MIKWLIRIAVLLLLFVLVAASAAWWLMHGSLPRLDGELALSGLSAPATIRRDKLGVVTIDAANETDAMRALGYVHAQERYFEMDLMRRTAAGELAELFGPVALDVDKRRRIHRMRARVMDNLDGIAGDKLPQLQAYADGVNAGLVDLKVRPWPYLLLRQQPRPWQLADSALTGYAMYFDLQDSTNARELALWKISRHVPPALFALLTRDGTRWDAPLMGAARGDAVLPTADQLDLRKLPAPIDRKPMKLADKGTPGSNSFAVAGSLTKDGRAIVANDMHLGLRAPNIWFRARLRYADARAPGGKVDVSGFTLPGLPAIVVGSNRHIAWGFTNSYADTADWAVFPPCRTPKPPDLDPAKISTCPPVRKFRETIRVAGNKDVSLEVDENFWGPIIDRRPNGETLALRWTAQLPDSLNFGLARLAALPTVQRAFAEVGAIAMPGQNLAMADASGAVGWRVLGAIPARDDTCQPALPFAADDISGPRSRPRGTSPSGPPCRAWNNGSARAAVLNGGVANRLWTANNRLTDGAALKQLGDGGYALGARARQIRDDLFAKQQFTERDLLAIQLDDRALFLQRWWQLLRSTSARADSPALKQLATAARTWQGRASNDSVSYRIVRAWRLAVNARIADGLTAPAQAALGDDFTMPDLPQLEGVAWPLVTQRPAHLLPRRYACESLATARASLCGDLNGWDALFEDAAREVRDELTKKGPLAQRTWGERNTAAICHPLAAAVPLIGKKLLCMPPDQLAGDSAMPRVAGPAFGASERMVVSPGHEEDGIIQMPGGQSGNPLSPFWGAGHDDWVRGRPTPFLPGKAEYTLRLEPAGKPL